MSKVSFTMDTLEVQELCNKLVCAMLRVAIKGQEITVPFNCGGDEYDFCIYKEIEYQEDKSNE